MSGFPTRVTASAFGPRMRNRGAPRDPERDVSAERMNLMRWQLAGVGQVTPLAWVLATFTAPDVMEIAAQGNAWQGAPPKIQRLTTGIYLVSFAPVVKDDDGVDVAMNLLGAVVSPRASTPRLLGDWEIADGRDVTVRLFDVKENDMDGGFFVCLF